MLFIDKGFHNQCLARQCLNIVNELLKEDICRIDDCSKLNCDVEDLSIQLERYISDNLWYTCCYWADHIAMLQSDDLSSFLLLKYFTFNHILHWLEVLSHLGRVYQAVLSLLTACQYCGLRFVAHVLGCLKLIQFSFRSFTFQLQGACCTYMYLCFCSLCMELLSIQCIVLNCTILQLFAEKLTLGHSNKVMLCQ
jgi:hypothetical protein